LNSARRSDNFNYKYEENENNRAERNKTPTIKFKNPFNFKKIN
jgi:hypothetical protein